MVALPNGPRAKIARIKNAYGQDISELAQEKRGGGRPMVARPGFKSAKPPTFGQGLPTKTAGPRPSPSNGSNPNPTVTQGLPPGGQIPKTFGPKQYTPNPQNKESIFLKNHPILASKTGAAKDKFLANHPRIAARSAQVVPDKQISSPNRFAPDGPLKQRTPLSQQVTTSNGPALGKTPGSTTAALLRRMKRGF